MFVCVYIIMFYVRAHIVLPFYCSPLQKYPLRVTAIAFNDIIIIASS